MPRLHQRGRFSSRVAPRGQKSKAACRIWILRRMILTHQRDNSFPGILKVKQEGTLPASCLAGTAACFRSTQNRAGEVPLYHLFSPGSPASQEPTGDLRRPMHPCGLRVWLSRPPAILKPAALGDMVGSVDSTDLGAGPAEEDPESGKQKMSIRQSGLCGCQEGGHSHENREVHNRDTWTRPPGGAPWGAPPRPPLPRGMEPAHAGGQAGAGRSWGWAFSRGKHSSARSPPGCPRPPAAGHRGCR